MYMYIQILQHPACSLAHVSTLQCVYSRCSFPYMYAYPQPQHSCHSWHHCIAFHRLLTVLQGIVNAYQHAVQNMMLEGPTNFSSILDTAIKYASVRENQQSQGYFILLIITVSVHLNICVCMCVCVCVCICVCVFRMLRINLSQTICLYHNQYSKQLKVLY